MRRADDFEDDGGTPAWRARHARVIDVRAHEHRWIAWFRKQSLPRLMWYALLLGLVLPWGVLVGGLLLAYAVSR